MTWPLRAFTCHPSVRWKTDCPIDLKWKIWVHYVLKMEIKRDRKEASECQPAQSTGKVRYGGLWHRIDTPSQKCGAGKRNTKPKQISAQPFDYRGLVGSLTYLVRGIRTGITNAVRELSKFLTAYKTHVWAAFPLACGVSLACTSAVLAGIMFILKYFISWSCVQQMDYNNRK